MHYAVNGHLLPVGNNMQFADSGQSSQMATACYIQPILQITRKWKLKSQCDSKSWKPTNSFHITRVSQPV